MKKTIFCVLLLFLSVMGARAQSVQLNTPVGGNVWSAGTKQLITWTASNMTDVRIDFSADNGQTWLPVAAAVPAALGRYEWMVPETPSAQCYIKVTDRENAAIFSINSTPFTIPQPQLGFTAVPGEMTALTPAIIRWEAVSIGKVNLYYAAENGAWKTIAENITASLSYYHWRVSDSLPAIKLKIASAADTTRNAVYAGITVKSLPQVSAAKNKGGGYDGHAAMSNAPANITMLPPIPEGVLFADMPVTVRWNYRNVEFLNLSFTADSGVTWQHVKTIPAALRSVNWNLPAVLSDKCRLRLSDTTDENTFALSPVFSISTSWIKLLEKPGQQAIAGAAHAITWQHSGVNKLDIFYSGNGGASWRTIATGVNAANRQYLLKVPDTLQTLHFKLVPTGAFSAAAQSVYPLLVMKPVVDPSKYRGGAYDGAGMAGNAGMFAKLLSPAKGSVLVPGANADIRWISVAVSGIRIEFSADSGAVWQPVTAVITADKGKYTWQVPAQLTQKGRIRLIDADNNRLLAVSDSVFSIVGGSLQLAIPARLQQVPQATLLPLRWRQTGIDSLLLAYSADNGASWTTIAGNVKAAAGVFNWQVNGPLNTPLRLLAKDLSPNAVADTTGAVVTILPALVPNTAKFRGGAYDGHALRSNITMLTLRAPAGGEIMRGGSTFNITWQSANMQDSVIIELSLDSGRTWRKIVQTPAQQGSYNWLIQEEYLRKAGDMYGREMIETVNDQCRIRVRGMRGEDDAVASNAKSFTIITQTEAPAIAVVKPGAADSVFAGRVFNITWSATGLTGNVNIAMSADSGLTWKEVATNIPNSGAFAWNVPERLSNTHQKGKGMIRIYAGSTTDTSEVFTWTQQVVTAVVDPEPGTKIKVYPNPASTFIYLEGSFASPRRFVLSVLDMSGRVLLEQQFDNIYQAWHHKIDVQAFQQGMVLLKLQQPGKRPVTVPVVILK